MPSEKLRGHTDSFCFSSLAEFPMILISDRDCVAAGSMNTGWPYASTPDGAIGAWVVSEAAGREVVYPSILLAADVFTG